MNTIAIGRDPGPTTFNGRYVALGVVVLSAIAIMASKLDLESIVGIDLNGDGTTGDPNDPNECLTARTMINEIDSDIRNYTNLMAATANPMADAYYLLQIARCEVEKKYIEYVYGCTSPYGDH